MVGLNGEPVEVLTVVDYSEVIKLGLKYYF